MFDVAIIVLVVLAVAVNMLGKNAALKNAAPAAKAPPHPLQLMGCSPRRPVTYS